MQQQELAKLDRLYHLLETVDSRMGQIANQTQEKIEEMSAGLREELGKIVDQKSKVRPYCLLLCLPVSLGFNLLDYAR